MPARIEVVVERNQIMDGDDGDIKETKDETGRSRPRAKKNRDRNIAPTCKEALTISQ